MSDWQHRFPSELFLQTYFGDDFTIRSRNDTGTYELSSHAELQRAFETALIVGPKHLIVAEDRHPTGVRTIYVFKAYQVHCVPNYAHFREILDEIVPLDEAPPKFERKLYDELAVFVTQVQPLRKDWWEWFAADGDLGVRFTPDAKDGGNQPLRSLAEIFNKTD